MKEVNFSDKVNTAFEMGWKSNPQYSKALKEIEEVIANEQDKVLVTQNVIKEHGKDKAITYDEGR